MQPSNPNYQRDEQYETAGPLTSRINLHLAFSTNPYGWFRWVFDQLELPPQARILELACGRGDLWQENMGRIPPGWDITLTDLSDGMLTEARARLGGAPHPFRFHQADIRNIPFPGQQFDGVIANHMLYYVRDKPRAFREILRVLKQSGSFFTTTVGERHMGELVDLAAEYHPGEDSAWFNTRGLDFLLENGESQLEPYFGHVQLRRYEDSLFITQPEPLVDYINSGQFKDVASTSQVDLRGFIGQKIKTLGGISILKDSGIFIARKGG